MAGLAAAFGSGAMTNSIAEIEESGCIFVIGSNTTACHPLIARRIFRAKERGAKLIVADPRNIQLSRFADVAVNHRLGSDVALLNGMMHVIIKNGWQAEDYIAQRTEDYEALEKIVNAYTPDKVHDITGVDPSTWNAWLSFTPPIRPPACCTPWASPSTPPGWTTSNPAVTWRCCAAMWGCAAAA